jgi:hypothetical protein
MCSSLSWERVLVFIHVDYRLEPGEFARGMTAAFRRGLWICVSYVVFALLLLAVMYGGHFVDLAVSPPALKTSGPVAAVGVYFLIQLCLRRPRLERSFRARRVDRVVATFTESGVSWRSWTQNGEHSSEVAWSGFARMRETPEFFLLYSGKRTVTVVPKRAFDAQGVELFSRFARDRFPQARSARSEFVPEGRS